MNKFGKSLGSSISALAQAAIYCINPENLVVSDNALDLLALLIPFMSLHQQEIYEAIEKSSTLCQND